MDDEKKKIIETETFTWMKDNEPASLEQDWPPWKCVLHVGGVLGVDMSGGQAVEISRELYVAWMKYRTQKDPTYADSYNKKLASLGGG